MTRINSYMVERNPRQEVPKILQAGFFMPVKNSLHVGKAVICGDSYGVEELNKGLINPNRHPTQNDRRKPTVLLLIETMTVPSNDGFINSYTETNMSNQPLTVKFHGTSLAIVEHNNQPFASAKQISDAIGLDWPAQYNKLSKNRARWGIAKIAIPSTSGKQSTICIPLKKLPGWLASINPSKVSNALRPRIIQYQNECDDVLWQHWEKQNSPADTSMGIPIDLQSNPTLALGAVDISSVDQATLHSIASLIARYQQDGEPVTITVLLASDREPVVKSMHGSTTAFPNEAIKSFMKHYDKATEFCASNATAGHQFLLSGSAIDVEAHELSMRRVLS